MSRLTLPLLAFAILAPAAAACSGDAGGDRRVIAITQTDDACTPATIELAGGERVRFEVKNEGGKNREIEGIDGTKLEEVLVPSGKTRRVNYTAPKDAGTARVKCYVPGGDSDIIELKVSGSVQDDVGRDDEDEDSVSSRETDKAPQATVHVELTEYRVAADRPSIPEGATKFTARNASASQIHELAVLLVKKDGSYENTGEVEDIDPGKEGSIVLDLPAGKYVLACLIVPGEARSATDHFKQGMRLDFEVK